MLEARNITYRAPGGCLLIDTVSLAPQPGKITVIIGPNGAGKSTLLRLLTGYLQPQQGECLLERRPLHAWSNDTLARRRAVMRQHSQLTFPFSVEEVIRMGRFPYQGAMDHTAWQTILDQTACSELLARDYRLLSGGEQQRVQLARVLMQLWQPEPTARWLFLDEPTSALDLYHQQQTLRLLKRLTQNGPLAVCCVLHDLNLAALYADEIVLLCQGRIVAQGAPAEILTEELLTRWYQADLGICPHPERALPQVYLRQ